MLLAGWEDVGCGCMHIGVMCAGCDTSQLDIRFCSRGALTALEWKRLTGTTITRSSLALSAGFRNSSDVASLADKFGT